MPPSIRAFAAWSLLLALALPFSPVATRPCHAQPARLASEPAKTWPAPAQAKTWLATIRPCVELQEVLDRAVAEAGRSDPSLRAASPRIAVLDLPEGGAPRLAEIRGDQSVYPASVVKFVYMMAAYAWQERGRLTIDAAMDAELKAMIHHSSNQATRKVFARLTETEPGGELSAQAYAAFREKRHRVKHWLKAMGIEDLHTVHPTYDGNGDLFGRDRQFLRDRSVPGGLPVQGDGYPNRQAMTASATARLLALLATDRALTKEDSAAARRRMLRNVEEQPYLKRRIAGGVSARPGTQVYSKTGTWGPIFADAGIVRDSSGRQFVIVFFTDASPPYRGDAIARVTKLMAAHLFATARPAPDGGPRDDDD